MEQEERLFATKAYFRVEFDGQTKLIWYYCPNELAQEPPQFFEQYVAEVFLPRVRKFLGRDDAKIVHVHIFHGTEVLLSRKMQ